MFKKLAGTMASSALFLVLATPAMATMPWHSDYAYVRNSSQATALTGGNSQSDTAYAYGLSNSADIDGNGGTRTIVTGNASANSSAVVLANTHLDCGCYPWFGRDRANVRNSSVAVSDTGYNAQDDAATALGDDNDAEVETDRGSSRTVRTGNAGARSSAWSMVNTHWAGGYIPLH